MPLISHIQINELQIIVQVQKIHQLPAQKLNELPNLGQLLTPGYDIQFTHCHVIYSPFI